MSESRSRTKLRPLSSSNGAAAPIRPEELRWRCDPALFDFETSDDIEPLAGVIGQDKAVDALRFGLEIDAPGQHVFVRGLTGTGRLTLVRRLLQEIKPDCPSSPDRCYVFNFAEPDRPKLINLPRGEGREFQTRIDELIDFVRDQLVPALSGDRLRARRSALEEQAAAETEKLTRPFQEELRKNGLALTTVQVGTVTIPAVLPLIEGRPVSPEKLQEMISQGQIGPEEAEGLKTKIEEETKRLTELGSQIEKLQRTLRKQVGEIYESEARTLLGLAASGIQERFSQAEVLGFLNDLVEDVIQRIRKGAKSVEEFARLYQVNLILSHDPDEPCPIIVENSPTLSNLLGTIEYRQGPANSMYADHHSIFSGSLLRADGGYLVVEARELLSEMGSWKALVRTLKSGLLEISPQDYPIPLMKSSLKPQPPAVRVKVILLGDAELYSLLDAFDSDFPDLFKVLADFDNVIQRDDASVRSYAGVIARIAREEGLLPFHREGIAQLSEHGARIAARQNRLTTRFGRLADIAREAAFLARKEGRASVSAENVREAIRCSKSRADLPGVRFRQMVSEGRIRIQTEGRVCGQVNGLAVATAGPLTYGFPARITASLGPGTEGTVNIEREAELSGAIHNKAFFILQGLLRRLLRPDHLPAFEASIAFEQSYGGIDGDSASGAEFCCLMSALTDVPLRQDLAMTGAIDQMGNFMTIGAVNEKIEGFFDVCRDAGLRGTEGVIIPRANLVDLMLREQIVEACREGKFHIYAASDVCQALEVLTGFEAGVRDDAGNYPPGTLLALAVDRLRELWKTAMRDRGSSKSSRREGGPPQPA